jgi:predicted membrane-bound spermidine synthase
MLFFGTHTVSSSTISISVLVSMALGSQIAGNMADRKVNRLAVLGILTGITGIYIVCHPLLFGLITGLFETMNNTLRLEPFGVEILRFLLSVLILLIPVGCMTGIFTFLIRHFIRHTGQSGKFMSSVIVSGCVGIILGLILMLYLVPRYGFRTTQICSALIFFLTAAFVLLLTFLKNLNVPAQPAALLKHRAKSTTLWFKKKKPVLETGVKLKRATIRVYIFQGISAAAYLLICFRILVNYSAIKPVYFHSLVIVVLLTGLILGSMFYKPITEKTINSYLTLATYQILMGFSAILSYVVFYFFHPVVTNWSLDAETFGALLLNHGLLYSTLLFLPAFIMGLSLPITGKLYPKRLQDAGKSFGRLGRIGFLSILAGLVFTRFVFIPLAGLYYAYFILVLLMILSGIYLILRDSRLIRGFRLGYAILAVVFYFVIISAFRTYHFSLPLSEKTVSEQPVRKIEGSTSTLSTIENENRTHTVWLNNRYFFSSDLEGMKVQLLPAYLPLMLDSGIKSAVVAGFGMGTTASTLEANGIQSIHITETFPEIIRFSSDVFAELNDDILTNSHVTLTIEDLRVFLNRMNDKTDLITTGSASLNLMPNNYTREFYQLCYEKLSGDGMICQVLPFEGITRLEFGALIKACSDVFPEVSLWYVTPERLLMVGSKSSAKPGICQLFSEFTKPGRQKELAAVGIPDPESLIAHLLLDKHQLREFTGSLQANLDNKPVVEYSRTIGSKTDAELIRFLMDSKSNFAEWLMPGPHCYADIQQTIRRVREINEALRQEMVPSSGLQ